MSGENRFGRRAALTLAAAAGVAWTAGRAAASPDNARYHGYSAEDAALPYARFMADRTAPPPEPVAAAFAGPPVAPDLVPDFATLTTDLAADGYSAIETGYGQTAAGVVWVAVRTEMPRVTAAMWDWWFGWHSTEPARYKLWHPDAHLFAALAEDRTAARIPDRDRYIGNISYVDEYVGPKLQQLAIAFQDPVAHGFAVPAGHTVVFGRVGSAIAPVDLGWLAHQVRPIDGGCEMRSRFHLNLRGLHAPDLPQAVRAVERGASVDPGDLVLGLDLGRDLLLHCGQEMHHLAGFLPELHAEFGA
ncbi:hypothetical protein BJY24_000044 [Nocardia transvalensis]|uniref:DAPG hydrolase PhiG domain-containing protein n=1 Tax=Nocardia transvalensis TaxID=37333 RepID=A0A7W9UFJ5_9NOCA|nr:hypothetical protein [Nocardia transvalensis]MBB5911177.1 hypothetical protein [Nocardia transvalensis]